MSHVVGLDVSTTATKAVLVDRDGRVAGVGAAEHVPSAPRPGWSEQDPADWWETACLALRRVLAETAVAGSDIAAIGLSGQMHGSVLLDDAGGVVRPAILWNDQRTAAACDEIRARVGREALIAVAGSDALTGFTAPKLLWVREHEPEAWAAVRHVLLPKDYVRHRLSGDLATDRADASGTLLLDVAARNWSRALLDALDLDPALLPRTAEGPDVTGVVTAEGAAATGLAVGTPIVAGGGDQAANAVGVGAVDPGVVALSLGTSGVVFAATDAYVVESAGSAHAFCHAVPDRWHVMGVMLSAAGSLRWYRDVLAPGAGFDDLVAEAAQAPAGSGDVLFLPYLTGERTPHPNARARGAFVGLGAETTRAHLTRAVLEGVAFGLRDGLDLMVAAGVARPTQIRASGGGVRSALWRQILADVLEAEIATVETPEGAAYGAALLAAAGVGWAPSIRDVVASAVVVHPREAPGADRARYAERHQDFRDLYPALHPRFDAPA